MYKYAAKLHMQCYIQLPVITYVDVHEPVHGILHVLVPHPFKDAFNPVFVSRSFVLRLYSFFAPC